MKKVISVVCLLSLLFISFLQGTNVKGEKVARVYAETVTCTGGDTVTIPIYLSGNQGVMGWSITVDYDSKKITPKEVKNGELTTSGLLNDSIETSKESEFDVKWATSDNVYGDGVLFYVVFDVLSDVKGQTTIQLTYNQEETYDNQYHDVVLTMEDIKISIGDGTEGETITSTSGMTVIRGGTIKLSDNSLDIPVLIDNNPGLMGYRIVVTYDTDVIQPISTVKNEVFVGNFDDNADSDDGKFSIIWSGTQGIKSNGELFKMKFKLRDPSVSMTQIKLKYVTQDTFDENYYDVSIECRNIMVDIDELLGRITTKPEQTTGQEETTKQEVVTQKRNEKNNSFIKKSTKIKKISSLKKGKAKISIKKIKGAKKYQIIYSTNRKLKNAKTIYSKKNVKTIKGLKKKKYYFKVRAYRITKGVKEYTKWSKVKIYKNKKNKS